MEHYPEAQIRPYKVRIIGDLPYYVPFPEQAILRPSLIDAEPFELQLEHFKPIMPEDSMHGDGVDNRLGTFIRSRIILDFKSLQGPTEPEHLVLEKALTITNRLVDAIKYLASDFSMRPIQQFDRFVIHYTQEGSEEIRSKEAAAFGPFGLTPTPIMTMEMARSVWWIFNGISPINPSRMLVLDAKYHGAIGDYSRAILDLGTALEIHIGWLISQYEGMSPELSRLTTDDKECYRHYDEILLAATAHSMREEENLFVALEYIRAIRNSITHEWKPIFRITSRFRSQYMAQHQLREGSVIDSGVKTDALVQDTEKILDYAERQFRTKFEKKYA